METIVEPRGNLQWGLRIVDRTTGEIYAEVVDWELANACQRAMEPIIRYRALRREQS